MKKIIVLLLILTTALIHAEILKFSNTDEKTETSSIEKDIEILKREIDELKSKTSFLDFKLSGGTKITWGINFNDNPFGFLGNAAGTKQPVHGFDFENNIKLDLNLNNNVVTKKNSDYDFSEVVFKFKMKTIRPVPYDYAPLGGDYYVVEAKDQDGNPKLIYFPKNDEGGNDLVVGNFKFVLEQARLSNLLGTGFFINYADVTNVNTYYGIEPILDVLKLNHDYFNNKFYGKNNLWYSFDYSDYEPEASSAEAVEFWSSNELSSTQSPHGFSFGMDTSITNQFDFFIEAGIASKDNFDPVKNTDNIIDYGFFLKCEPTFKTEQLLLAPKIHFGFAFQTQTVNDIGADWSSLNLAVSLPAKLQINDMDYASIELNTNYKRHIALADNAFMISLNPKLSILKNSLFINIPIQYWYKDGQGGLQEIKNFSGVTYTQIQEEHIFNVAFITGYKSNNFFSDNFEYKITNNTYLTTLYDNEVEFFMHNILKNEFYFYNVPFLGSYVTMESFVLYTDFGYALAKDARYEKYVQIDNSNVRVVSTEKLAQSNVLFGEFGFMMNFTPNMTAGFSVNSPKVNLDINDTIGNQNTYTTLKIWSEIKL